MIIKQGWLEELAIRFAYQVKKNREKPTMPLWASGWEVLCTSQDDEATRLYSYKAVVLVNHSTKLMQIASAGIKPKEIYDLWDGIRIFLGWVPNKLAPAKSLVDQVIKRLGGQQEALNYQFNCCGHSLGAVVSDLMIAELLSRGLNAGHSRTYDNPGSKNSIVSAIKQKLFSGCRVPSLEQLAKHGVEYNAPPNFINGSQPHLADKIYLVCPDLPTYEPMTYSSRNNTTVGSWIGNCKSALHTCANYLGLSTLATQLTAHRLQSLSLSAAPGVVEVVGWIREWPHPNKVVLKSSTPLAETLKALPATGDDCVLHEEKAVESGQWHHLELYRLSFNDLVNACSVVRQKIELDQQKSPQPISASIAHAPQRGTAVQAAVQRGFVVGGRG